MNQYIFTRKFQDEKLNYCQLVMEELKYLRKNYILMIREQLRQYKYPQKIINYKSLNCDNHYHQQGMILHFQKKLHLKKHKQDTIENLDIIINLQEEYNICINTINTEPEDVYLNILFHQHPIQI